MEKREAIPCLIKNTDGNLELNRKVQAILEQDDIKDKPIAVLSIIGIFRKGKSFFLNFLILYLEALEKGVTNNWLGDEEKPLTGFKWMQGCDKETEGMNVWPRPFKITKSDGRQVVVLLVDTQGMFDGGTENSHETLLFALTSLFSSEMIYNIQGTLSEDMLRHLQFYTEFAKLSTTGAINADHGKIFQRLVFLVRDWLDAMKYPFVTGGKDYLHDYLQDTRRSGELVGVKETILQCFDKQDCYLMSSPGERALERRPGVTFTGKLSELREDFIQCVQEVAPLLLSPGQLVLKKVAGSEINAGQYLRFLKETLQSVQTFDGPLSQTACQALRQATISFVADKLLGEYQVNMEKFCEGDSFIPEQVLADSHGMYMIQALGGFDSKIKSGGETQRTKLTRQIQNAYAAFKNANVERKQELQRQNDAVKNEAIELYRSKGNEKISQYDPCADPEQMEKCHTECFNAAMEYYDERAEQPELMQEQRKLLELMLGNEWSTLLIKNLEKQNKNHHHDEQEGMMFRELIAAHLEGMKMQHKLMKAEAKSQENGQLVDLIGKLVGTAMPVLATVLKAWTEKGK